MNKTVTINIAGLVFHIDDEAYNKLDSYIKAVRNSIEKESEDEIIADIESRIAELFTERIDSKSGVISMNNVDEIINIMGKPEDYIIEEEHVRPQDYTSTTKTYKKIYRDGERRVFGGICSGLAHYFNIDPLWVRIIFILLFFIYGISIFAYLILWVIIPKAVTVSDVLEMKGEPVNISNIEKQFREGVSTSYQNIRNTGSSVAHVIRRIIGVILIVFAVLGIFGSFFTPIAVNSDKFAFVSEFMSYEEAQTGIPFWGLSLSLFVMCVVPFIILLLLGIKILNTKVKHIGWVSGFLGFIWLVSVFIFSYVMINLDIQKDKFESLFEDNFDIKSSQTDLNLNDNDTLNLIFQKDQRIFTINDTLTGKHKFSEVDDIDVEIYESNTGRAYMEIEEKVFNNNELNFKTLSKYNIQVQASKNSNTLNYDYSIKSDTLVLSNAILTNLNSFTEDSKVKIKLYITENQTIKLNSNDSEYFWNVVLDHGKNYYKFNSEGNLENTIKK